MPQQKARPVRSKSFSQSGNDASLQAVNEALLATLVSAFPHLTEQFRENLGVLAEMKREALQEEAPDELPAFDHRLRQTLGLLIALENPTPEQ
ncbi:MAG: hypothetical protein V4731_08560 [Pseudomonadota bacterium]